MSLVWEGALKQSVFLPRSLRFAEAVLLAVEQEETTGKDAVVDEDDFDGYQGQRLRR